MRLDITTKKKIFCIHTTNLVKVWFLVVVSTKGQKRDKNEYVTKFIGIIVYVNYLIVDYFKDSQILCKLIATQFFFTDHLKKSTVNKNF